MTSYLLSVNVPHENEKNKNGRLYNMLKHYFCKYTIDMYTLFWGSYSLSFICGHIGLCAFTYSSWSILHYVYPCQSVFPSVMFWIPFNNLSLPWTWSNVLKLGCVKNHKRHLCRMFTFFFILLYFLLVKYRIKIHVEICWPTDSLQYVWVNNCHTKIV